jgi:DNA repair protein RadC
VKTVFETRWAKVGETPEHYRTVLLNNTEESRSFGDRFLRPYFSDKLNQEEFLVITLDVRFRPIRIVRVSRGTLDASIVHPREVFRAAIADCAHSVILAHNHPSGDPTPSPQDIATTERIREAGRIIGINVLDHLVVGDRVVSMASEGCM